MVKVYGIKKVASEMKHIPSGFHLEIWACKKGSDYEVWTSALLTTGSWTVYKQHPEYRRIDRLVNDYRFNMDDRQPSITESIKAVIEDAFKEDE